MITRAERRRRNKIIWNRRAKLFYRICWANIPCEYDESPVNDNKIKINHHYWKPAENWKEYQKKNPTMRLYKNTGTIYDHGYWSKYERHRLHKQSRYNAKLDIKNGIEVAFERTDIK